MLEDTVYQVTRKSDSSHTRMTRRNQPHTELQQFWGIGEIDRVTHITEACDFGHTGRRLLRLASEVAGIALS